MKIVFKLLVPIIAVGFTMPIFADIAPHNCDTTPPPSGYNVQHQGDAEWKRCYMDSALGECQIGHVLEPIKCNTAIIQTGLITEYYDGNYKRDCQQEFAMGYLPVGATEQSCEQDWSCYIDSSSCQ